MPYLSEIAALLTALCWLCSSMAFAVASREAGADATNLFRLYAALLPLAVLGWLTTGSCWPTEGDPGAVTWLAVSGLVGLTIGDLALFHALGTIGPRLGSVIMALWPGMTVGIDALRGAVPSTPELVGIALTVGGVMLVLRRSREGSWRPELPPRQWTVGIVCAFVGALGQAAGFVIASDAMQPVVGMAAAGDAMQPVVGMAAAGDAMQPGAEGGAAIPPLLATIVRMVAATIGMQLVAALRGKSLVMKAVLQNRRAHVAAWLGATFGPVLGVWLSMVAAKDVASRGVASALMSTTPVFMLPIAVRVYGARVGPLAVLGTLLAVAGVAVCFVFADA